MAGPRAGQAPRSERAPERRHDDAQLVHQPLELLWLEGLRAVRERAVGVVVHLDEQAVEALMAYDWPGNIRELENVIERAVVLADGPAITLADLAAEVRRPTSPRRRTRPSAAVPTGRLALAVPRHAGPVGHAWEPEPAAADSLSRPRALDGTEVMDEDDFDACVTAAALLRCILEGAPLCPAQLQSPASEGGMLGTGSVNLRFARRRVRTAPPRYVRNDLSPARRSSVSNAGCSHAAK